MSHYSGYSSASRMELAKKDKEMAKKDQEMLAMATQMSNMQAILEANGLVPAQVPVSAQPASVDQTANLSVSGRSWSQIQTPIQAQGISLTPSRKRHSSQQLERVAKVAGGANRNRFEILTQADSYPDRSMRPGSVVSIPGGSIPVLTYASKLSGVKNVNGSVSQLASSSSGASDINQSQDQIGAKANSTRSDSAVVHEVGQNHRLVEGLFDVQNKGGMRQEIEIALEKLNGEPFRGTITPLEAKYGIYAECLGFPDFGNFEGYRFGHKGVPVITLILKSAINVDELLPVQYFDYHRKSSRQGRSHTDIISCKIRGLRDHSGSGPHHTPHGVNPGQQDDGTRTVRIEGCEYRVPKEALMKFLSCYGEVTSDILEVVFNDGNAQDGIRIGTYSVNVKLNRELPQLAPIMGKRVKFYYRGIQKLCPKCFGSHQIKTCRSQKVQWLCYVENFIARESGIPSECYGRWLEIISNEKSPLRRNHSNRPSLPEQSDLFHLTSKVTVDRSGGRKATPPSPTMSQVQDTETWIKNLPKSKTPTQSSKAPNTDPDQRMDDGRQESSQANNVTVESNGPREKDFHLPTSQEEHKFMVEKLVSAGTLPSEAEQIINNRRTAFNKATREFKKLQPARQTKQYQKKVTKSNKAAGPTNSEYAA